jgi:hypothetical protein
MFLFSAMLLVVGCATKSSSPTNKNSGNDSLVGAWRARVQFKSGAFSAVKNLEFMYVINSGGTMTESSNYDASPPAPPAYGVWRRVQPRHYEAKYVFFLTKAPRAFEDIAGGGGWSPGGSGVLVETITLSEDGKTFKSTIRLDVIDEVGKPTESHSDAEAQAVRISF